MSVSFMQLQKMIPEAYERIKKKVLMTPLEESLTLSNENRKVFLKLECVQTTRSFKIRGAMNKILSLSEEERAAGIIAVSSGNHGAAVSYAGQQLGIEETLIFVPTVTPKEKTDKISYYGGTVRIEGSNYDETHNIGMSYVEHHGMTYVDAYDKDPLVYAGQGTVGLEILRQNPNIDTIIVPIGGGGLITGVSAAVKAINPYIRIIGVQTSACPAMQASIDEGVFYSEYPIGESVCEALVGGVGELAYSLHEDAIDEIIVVEEASIKAAVNHMLYKEKVIAEPSSCICVAALLQEEHRMDTSQVAIVISGGNIDEELLHEIITK